MQHGILFDCDGNVVCFDGNFRADGLHGNVALGDLYGSFVFLRLLKDLNHRTRTDIDDVLIGKTDRRFGGGRGTDNVAVIHGGILHRSVPHGAVEKFALYAFIFVRNGCNRHFVGTLDRLI